MDSFTQKLLERTRMRREQLQQKLQRTPSTTDEQIADRGLRESPINVQASSSQGDPEEKKQKLAGASVCVKPDTPAIPSLRQRMSALSQQDKENAPGDDQLRGEHGTMSRQGRLAELAQQINNWEDDLHHVSARKADTKKKMVQPTKSSQPNDNPPKPPRTFQQASDVSSQAAFRSGSDVDTASNQGIASSSQSDGDCGQASAFSFGSAPSNGDSAPVINSQGLTRRALRPSNDPATASVADRFAAWEQRTVQGSGDTDSNSLQRDGPATRTRTKSANVALWEEKVNGAKGAAPVLCLPPPCPLPADLPPRATATQRRRSRSHNGTPLQHQAPWAAGGSASKGLVETAHNAHNEATPRRPAAAATAAPMSTGSRNVVTPAASKGASASHRKDESEDEWHKAPMSARKSAWEQKIAEQQNIAEEHSRLMYRQLSGSNQPCVGQTPTGCKTPGSVGAAEVTPARKLAAERQLSQTKEYDPAAKAKSERAAELQALNDRYKNGILKYDGGPGDQSTTAKAVTSGGPGLPTAAPRTAACGYNRAEATAKNGSPASALSSVKRGFEEALVGDGYEVEKSTNGKSLRVAKVSFNEDTKPTVGTRRKSSSPIDSQPRRRSSCKIPKLGYDSSDSSDVDESPEMSPVPSKNLSSSASAPSTSSVKIPSIGYDSTTDELSSHDTADEDQCLSSTTVSPTSTDSDSYHVEEEINDLLEDALNSDSSSHDVAASAATTGASKYINPRYDSPADEPSTPVAYSIDAYRSMRKKVENKAPAKNICFKPPSCPGPVPTNEPVTPKFSKQDVIARMKELQELAQHEQSVITQTSNALNQCSSNSQFAGSLEQVECNRLLLIACQKRQAYLAEIERLKCLPLNGHLYPPTGKGSLTICDIQLPLKRDFVQRSEEDSSVHYFVLMVRSGPQIIVTQMVSTQDAISRGVLHIPNMIKLNDIMNDFKYELEIYSMHVSQDSLKTPRKDKKKSSKSKNTLGYQGQSSTLSMRATSFTQITSLSITMANINQTAFTLPRVPFLSPLQGVIHMRLTCVMECNVIANGFLSMFEDVAGFGAWHRRWCVLNNNKLSYWKYPDDEKIKDPIGHIDLKLCVTETIQLVSRDKCARPNTLEVILHRPSSAERGSRQREKVAEDVCWLSADTKDDRVFWSKKLNEAVTNIRQWYAEAAQPVRQQKPRI